jgi:hypothetical protein
MADDAGALLVRSGLVSPSALDSARAVAASQGGTLGEQLVAAGAIADDALTDFYRSRLLVPQVNPNTLARLPVRVVATIPGDMAIELRAIPVSLDNDNNLTVAMSDPSDRHAVDEIAFFTGTYVVRAVATQMQIAWCLAHYYGHVTELGQRLLQPSHQGPVAKPVEAASSSSGSMRRARGHTGRVDAARHRAIAPITNQINIQRPNSGELDVVRLGHELDDSVPGVPSDTVRTEPITEPMPMVAPREQKPEPEHEPEAENGAPDRPRPRSVSGEIRVVQFRRAPSIRPPLPPVDELDELDANEDEETINEDPVDSGPVITMEVSSADEDETVRFAAPRRKRPAKSDPPELAARFGEVEIRTGPVRRLDVDEPRIIIDEEPLPPDVSGEIRVIAHRDTSEVPASTIEVADDTSEGVMIRDHLPLQDSEPVLLERRRTGDSPAITTQRAPTNEDGQDTTDDEVVVLDALKPRTRKKENTQVGIGAVPALTRTTRDTETHDLDPTRVDGTVAPSSGDEATDEIAAPPSPSPPLGLAGKAIAVPATARSATRDEEDNDEPAPPPTPHEIGQRRDYDSVDDGWGPPGTTIPPPLLGALPGTEDGRHSAVSGEIPVPDIDSAPLIVAPPTPPEPARGAPGIDASGAGLVRALETSTSRAIELIHSLERTQSRDDVVKLMIAHLAETHRRAGFFSLRPTTPPRPKANELSVFSMQPPPQTQALATITLDRPSTLQDVVGTRLPYRGPMHDDASRNFLAAVLGACPPEILLVPVAIRERVVGVLFGEHRMRHTFDDQLALAARAAGMALERIIKAKRG